MEQFREKIAVWVIVFLAIAIGLPFLHDIGFEFFGLLELMKEPIYSLGFFGLLVVVYEIFTAGPV